MTRRSSTYIPECPQTAPAAPGTTKRSSRDNQHGLRTSVPVPSFVIGFDLGFAKSPTAAALLGGFDRPQPYLIDTHTIRPRCGGDWQDRVGDVLEQIKTWLAIEVLPFYPPLLIAYSLPHLRERRDEETQPLRKGKNERARSTKVLNAQTALKLADLGGGIRGLAVGFGLSVIGVQESESKVALASNPRATKAAMIAAAAQVFGRKLTEHEADAAAHGLAGEANYRREQLVRSAGPC